MSHFLEEVLGLEESRELTAINDVREGACVCTYRARECWAFALGGGVDARSFLDEEADVLMSVFRFGEAKCRGRRGS